MTALGSYGPECAPDFWRDLVNSLRRSIRPVAVLSLVVIALLGMAATAEAVPAFARKYQTSCQTCHAMFPKLNAFGEAFRLRGYRMPGQTDDMVKEKPVSLGAPAYKRLWPEAIWPGEISSAVPLAINMKLASVSTSTLNDDGSVTRIHNDLQFPQELNIFGAGTLGDHVSYLGEVTFGANPDGSVSVDLEHAHIGFDSPFGPEDLFHFRVGKFAPNIADGFQEMWISTDAGIDSLFAYSPIGFNGGTGLSGGGATDPISLPKLVQGIEGYGIIRHRAMWVAGLANGIGPSATDTTGRFDGNNAKDVYARFDYKIGGMGLDGDTGGQPVPDKNWRDNSVRLGVFTYRGDGSGIDFPMTTADGLHATIQDTHFLRTGIYASVYYQDLNVFGAYLHGTDSLRVAGAETATSLQALEPAYHAWFTQADYMIYPWLQATGRFETVTPADPTVPSLKTGVFNISALIRANVKAMVEYQRDLREGDNHSLNVILRFAF
jgi:hypothetical protein